MKRNTPMRHGGKILIEQLELQGVTSIFTVPGESFLAALDGLYGCQTIRTITCRQEGGAAMMAEAWGKLTGKPGVCFVTRGPGAANAMAGLHIAQQDSTPMILFVGLPDSGHEDREAFQEIEVKQLFSSFVKWAGVIRASERIPEYVSRAFHLAQSGRPGPVVLGLPEDMLSAQGDPGKAADMPAAIVAQPAPRPADMIAFRNLLAAARKPLMIVGGPGWRATTARQVADFAARYSLPLATSFRCQDYIDNRHPCYVGHVGIAPDAALADAVASCDLLIAMGPRLGEMTTSGYRLVTPPIPTQKLVHIHLNPDELGAHYAAALPINASASAFAEALTNLPAFEPAAPWTPWRNDLRKAAEASWVPQPTPGDVQMETVVATASETLPDDAIITNGAGNYAAFLHRYFVYKTYRTQLAPTSGSMGYGLPAAIAAKLAKPEAPVVCFAGDGCLMMSVQELATAVQYDLPVILIVANNGIYGTIRMHQERQYPERVSGTTLRNPDFAAMARSFGADGELVTKTIDFLPAFQRALAARRPALIELKLDPEALTPRQTLSAIRQKY